jgi:hypothetical protein
MNGQPPGQPGPAWPRDPARPAAGPDPAVTAGPASLPDLAAGPSASVPAGPPAPTDPAATAAETEAAIKGFDAEIRDAVRYEKGLVLKALAALALVALVVLIRLLFLG